MKIYGIIYITTCLVNGKVYIGQTIHWQDKSYLGSGVALCEAVKKYGRSKFKRKILKVCYNQKQLDAWEMIMIRKYNSTDKSIGYNILSGTANEFGCGSPAKLPEVREKIRRKSIGRKLSEETRKKISKIHSGENSYWYGKTGEQAPMYGKKLSEEAKKKISKVHKGKKVSENTRNKISIANSGKVRSNEVKLRISNKMKGRFVGSKHPMFGKVWINNGVENKVILKTDKLPLNWKYGCIKKK